jgi:hypothetical protein
MRIYKGWHIKSTSPDSQHLNGAEIRGSITLRGKQFYYLRLQNGSKSSIRRTEILTGIKDSLIQLIA